MLSIAPILVINCHSVPLRAWRGSADGTDIGGVGNTDTILAKVKVCKMFCFLARRSPVIGSRSLIRFSYLISAIRTPSSG